MKILQVARLASNIALLAEVAAVHSGASRARDFLRELRRLLDDHGQVLGEPRRGATRPQAGSANAGRPRRARNRAANGRR